MTREVHLYARLVSLTDLFARGITLWGVIGGITLWGVIGVLMTREKAAIAMGQGS